MKLEWVHIEVAIDRNDSKNAVIWFKWNKGDLNTLTTKLDYGYIAHKISTGLRSRFKRFQFKDVHTTFTDEGWKNDNSPLANIVVSILNDTVLEFKFTWDDGSTHTCGMGLDWKFMKEELWDTFEFEYDRQSYYKRKEEKQRGTGSQNRNPYLITYNSK